MRHSGYHPASESSSSDSPDSDSTIDEAKPNADSVDSPTETKWSPFSG